METIFLSTTAKNTAGGRPKRLGTLEFRKGGIKVFIGYEEQTGRKVLVDISTLEQIFSLIKGSYQISFEIVKTRRKPLKTLINHFV